MIVTTRKVRFVRRPDKSRAIEVAPTVSEAAPAGRVPRISRLMALAIQFDQMIREEKVRDQSELARLAHVTQPRMTQIMNLNHLAPHIQESLLFLPVLERGREVVHEKTLRMITSEWNWDRQREMWNGVERRRTKVEPVASGS
jgi:hypothetical protein